MKFVYWWTISDNGWSNLPLARRPVVGYLNRSMMASNRLCNTSNIITCDITFEHRECMVRVKRIDFLPRNYFICGTDLKIRNRDREPY